MIEREMLEYTTAELWETLLGRDEVARCQALDELAEREDNTIAPLVVASLARGLALPCDMTPVWRNALIKATPRIQVTDESLRSVLASSLLKHAFDLKHGGGDEGILWTAIRRYATQRSGRRQISRGCLPFLTITAICPGCTLSCSPCKMPSTLGRQPSKNRRASSISVIKCRGRRTSS